MLAWGTNVSNMMVIVKQVLLSAVKPTILKLCLQRCTREGDPPGGQEICQNHTCVEVSADFYYRFTGRFKWDGMGKIFPIGYKCKGWFQCPEGICQSRTCRSSQRLEEGQTGCNFMALCEEADVCVNDKCVMKGCISNHTRCHDDHKCCDAGFECSFQVEAAPPPLVPPKLWGGVGRYCVPKKTMDSKEL